MGACDRELELPRQPAKLPGGSLRGGWSTGALGPNCAIAFGEGFLRCPLFGALRGRRRGRSGRRPECSRERGPARSARLFWARWERGACFSSGARGPLPSLQLSLALALLKVSLRSALLMRGARCCASRSIKARGAPRAGNENCGITAREETQQEAVLSPRGRGPGPEELPLHAPQVYNGSSHWEPATASWSCRVSQRSCWGGV